MPLPKYSALTSAGGVAKWISNSGYYNREVSVKIDDQGLIKDLLSEAEKDFVK